MTSSCNRKQGHFLSLVLVILLSGVVARVDKYTNEIKTNLDDIVKSDDVMTPLMLRKDVYLSKKSSKSYYSKKNKSSGPLLNAFFKKAGMNENIKKVSKSNKSKAKQITKQIKKTNKHKDQHDKSSTDEDEDEDDDSDSYGYAYATIYQNSTSCSSDNDNDDGGVELYSLGLKTNKCINYYGSYSIIVTCEDDEISYFGYKSTDCSTSYYTSKTVTSTGCKSYDDTILAGDDDSLGESDWSVNIQCSSTSDVIPLSGDYDVLEVFVEDTAGDTTCDDMFMFEASPIDTCIPYTSSGTAYSLYYTQVDESPYVQYYLESSTCDSSWSVTYALSSDCTAYGSQCKASYSYDYAEL